MRLVATLLGILLLVACPAPPKEPDPATVEATAEAAIRAIPAPDPSKFSRINSPMKWVNPYLVITKDGVDLVDYRNNEARHLKPDELVPVLGKLPASSWPYGRVVGASEHSSRDMSDSALIRKNRGIVAGTLEGLQVQISWLPPA